MDPDIQVQLLQEALQEYAQHSSWRCGTYRDCHCGLDELTDRLEIPRIPYDSH